MVWAKGDENAYGRSWPGSQGYEDERAREDKFKQAWAIAAKEKGPLTPDYQSNRAAVMDLYRSRARTAAPADVVAAKARLVGPSGAGQAVQGGAASHLATAAAGGGPSIAGGIAQGATEDAIRARLASMASTPRGASGALASQAAGGAMATGAAQGAIQAALTRSGEQFGAASSLGALSGSMRQGDIGTAAEANRMALTNADLAQRAGIANQAAGLQWQAMSDAEKRAALGMLMGVDQNEMQNQLNYYNFKSGLTNRYTAQSIRDAQLEGERMGAAVSGAARAAGYGVDAYYANEKRKAEEEARKRGGY